MANPIVRLIPVAKTPWITILTSSIVIISSLYFAKALLVPIALAALLSFVLSPVCRWLETFRIGRVPAVVITAFLGFSLLGIVIGLAATELASISPKIPEYQRNLETKFRSINRYTERSLILISETLGGFGDPPSQADQAKPQGTVEHPFTVRIAVSPLNPVQVFGSVYETLAEVVGTAAIVIVLVIFFLVRREDLRDRFIYLVGRKRVTVTTSTMQDAAARVSSYLSTLFLLNLAFGISVGIGLYLIGIPSATLWGILAMTLRFIPYLGPWIAAALPLGISLAISSSWFAPLFTALLFVVLELFNNNFLEPWLYGKNTGISPVAVLVAAFFWMWLWGPIGLLLATPLTVCVLVVGKHVPELSFLNILLGAEQVFEMKERVYQRLLAGDQDKAVELLDECLQSTSITDAYGNVLLPVLVRAEIQRHVGELNAEKHGLILQSMKDIVQYRGEQFKELAAKTIVEKKVPPEDGEVVLQEELPTALSIFCLGANTEADAISAAMIAQIFVEQGYIVPAVIASGLANETVELLARCKRSVICLVATPPAAVMHARLMARRLHGSVPDTQLIVGLWDTQRDLIKAKERIGCNAIVVGTIADMVAQVRLLDKP